MSSISRVTCGGFALLATASSVASLDPVVHRTFADDLTAKLYTNKNECSSALGVSMAFSLIYPGCTGDGIMQIRDTLGYPSASDTNNNNNMQLVWKDTTKRMLDKSDGQCVDGEWEGVCNSHAPLLQIANSIWFHNVNALHPDYEAVVGTFAKQIDLGADESPLIVNEWVKDSTNGLIDSIVDPSRPVYPPIELVEINSIYLKASWAKPFHEPKTNLDSFYTSQSRSDEVSKAHFMNGVLNNVAYSHEAIEGYQIVQLPFASSQMSMIFVLPLSDDAGSVASNELLSVLDNLETTRVALSIPKFKFETTYDDSLMEAVKQAGIVAPFSGGSLCGLFADDNTCSALFIQKIIQKTVIDVNELGVEAAAVTAIMVGRGAPPIFDEEPQLMVCDHPFQFFIYDKSEDLVLFEGRVGAPEVPEVKPEVALLDSMHSDGDFWSNEFYVDPIVPPKHKVESTRSVPSSIGRFLSPKKCFSLVIGVLIVLALGLVF